MLYTDRLRVLLDTLQEHARHMFQLCHQSEALRQCSPLPKQETADKAGSMMNVSGCLLKELYRRQDVLLVCLH